MLIFDRTRDLDQVQCIKDEEGKVFTGLQLSPKLNETMIKKYYLMK